MTPDKQREADQAGYYCILEALHRLALITGREGPIAVTDTELASCFIEGVRERVYELSDQIRQQEWQELQEEQP